MGISGILLNHPELIKTISVPKYLIPGNYKIENWNRSTLSDIKFSKRDTNLIVIGGYEGVFISRDRGSTFSRVNRKGLENSQYFNKTKSIYILENTHKDGILAGTFGGLNFYDFKTKIWEKIPLKEYYEKVVKIIDYKNEIAVFTSSNAYLLQKENIRNAKPIALHKNQKEASITLIELFFHLHSGEIWGLPGKIIFDLAGLIMIFLSISGLYLWITPKSIKLKIFKTDIIKENIWKIFRWTHNYHLKLGIYASTILLIMGVTGFFMRPPAIVAIMNGEIAISKIPGLSMPNPWEDRIRNAMYDRVADRMIIDAKDGFWLSDKGLAGKYSRTAPPVPIFAMGATVLEQESNGDYLIGSFAGLYRVLPENGEAIDALTGRNPYNISLIRPGSNLITSQFTTPAGDRYITTHFGGLQPVMKTNHSSKLLSMPKEFKSNYSMSLWNYLFELHNGRIFEFMLGDFYILLIPLASLIFIISLFTGVFDWFYIKIMHLLNRKKRPNL